MKFRLTVIAFFICVSLGAQGGFVKFLDPGPIERNEVFDIYYDSLDNAVFILGNEVDTFFGALKLIKMDTNGVVLKESVFKGDSTFSYALNANNNICKIDSNKFQVFGDLLFSGLQHFVYWFDRDLDSIRYDIIPEPMDITSRVSRGSYFINDRIYLTSNKTRSDSRVLFDIDRLDPNLQITSEFTYKPGNTASEYFANIVPSLDDETILLGNELPQNSSESNALIIQVDSFNNILSEKNGIADDGDGRLSQGVLYRDSNSNVNLAFGNTHVEDNNGEFLSSIRFFITDLEGNIIDSTWIRSERSVFNYLSHNIRIDDNFVVAGQIKPKGQSAIRPIVARINEKADTLWTLMITVKPGADVADRNIVTGLTVLPSGSILICGNHIDFNVDPNVKIPFIIKLDKDGCIEPGCRPTSSIKNIDLQNTINVYPNPTKGSCTIDSKFEGIAKIYLEDGKLLLSTSIVPGKNIIDLKGVPKGVLIYKVEIREGEVSGRILRI